MDLVDLLEDLVDPLADLHSNLIVQRRDCDRSLGS